MKERFGKYEEDTRSRFVEDPEEEEEEFDEEEIYDLPRKRRPVLPEEEEFEEEELEEEAPIDKARLYELMSKIRGGR